MIYTLECPDCMDLTEFAMGMDDGHIVVDCPSCGRGMTRRDNRNYQSDPVEIVGETCSGNRRVSYEYMDPTLGYVKSKQDRAEKMKRKGLVDYTPDPNMYKHRAEARRIRSQANPAGDIEAAKAIRTELKAADLKRRVAGVKRAFDKAPPLVIND